MSLMQQAKAGAVRAPAYTVNDLASAVQAAGLSTDSDSLKRFAAYHQSTGGTLSDAAIRMVAQQPLATH